MQYALSITIDPILCRMYEIDSTSSLLFETFALKSFQTQISTKVLQPGNPPVDLYLNFEKSSWKNQFWQTGFLACKNSISKIIFEGYTGSKNQVWNRLKIKFVELDFSKLIFQKSSTDQQGEWRPRYFKTSPLASRFWGSKY